MLALNQDNRQQTTEPMHKGSRLDQIKVLLARSDTLLGICHDCSMLDLSAYTVCFQAKVRVLQSYVNDLSEQNEVLVQTVEELEREANERVELLEAKLQKTSGTHKVGSQTVLVYFTVRVRVYLFVRYILMCWPASSIMYGCLGFKLQLVQLHSLW